MTPPELGRVLVPIVVGALGAYVVARWWRRRVSHRESQATRTSEMSEPPSTRDRFDQEPEA